MGTPVTTKGNAFYTGDKRWYMRGIDYQPGGAAANIDPLADPDICLRDIKEFKDLGVNTIRVYAVDNKKDHDECMKALDDAGIYLVLDVNNPQYSINRADPHISYNAKYLQSVFATVEMFAQYDNVAAFFSGNEVINDEEDTDKAAPYVKAVTRDMRTTWLNAVSARCLSATRLPMCPRTANKPPTTSTAALMTCAPISSPSTITPGATPTSRPRAGTRRLRTSPTTVFPSSCLNGVALRTVLVSSRSSEP